MCYIMSDMLKERCLNQTGVYVCGHQMISMSINVAVKWLIQSLLLWLCFTLVRGGGGKGEKGQRVTGIRFETNAVHNDRRCV